MMPSETANSPDDQSARLAVVAAILLLGGIVILGQPAWETARHFGRDMAMGDVGEIYSHAAHEGSAWSERRVGILALLGSAFGAMVLGYLLALLAASRRRLGEAGVWVTFGLVVIGALATPLTLSTDALSYTSRGHMIASLGLNPYQTTPGEVDRWFEDPLLRTDPWTDVRCIYGFAWSHIMGAVRLTAGLDLFWNVMLYKAVQALGLTALLILCWRLWPADDRRGRAVTLVLVGLNPTAFIETANNAHNEGVMMALWLGATLAAMRGPGWLAGVLLGLAAGIKWAPLGAAPLLALHLLRRRGWGSALAFGVAMTLAFGIPSLAFQPWERETWLGLSNQSRTFGGASLAAVVGDRIVRITGEPIMILRTAQALHLLWLGLLALIALLALVRPSPPERADERLLADQGWGALATAVLGATFYAPWYTLWVLPFAALARRHSPGLAGLAIGISLASPFSLLPPITLGTYAPAVQRIMFLIWTVPAVLGFFVGRHIASKRRVDQSSAARCSSIS